MSGLKIHLPKNKCNPSAALKPVAAKTLNLSTTPKYSDGTIFIPNAPTSIIIRAVAAQMPYERQSLFFMPAMIIVRSEAIDSITTMAVIIICAVAQGKHTVAYRRNKFHCGECVDPTAQKPCFFALYSDTYDYGAQNLAYVIKTAELVPKRKRRSVCGAEVAHRL